MLQEDRYLRILDHLDKHGIGTYRELASAAGASTGTVRRDLKKLEEHGMLRIVRGGAVAKSLDLTRQIFDIRRIEHVPEKSHLSEALGSLIREGQTVAMNGGTTNVEAAKFLARHYSRLIILTNNLRIPECFRAAPGIRVIVPHGLLDHEEHAVYGYRCEQELLSYNADAALLAVNAISPERGISDFRLHEAGIIRSMISISQKKIVVADHSKLDRTACMTVCSLDEIDLIVTDAGIPDTGLEPYRQAGVRVIASEGKEQA